MATIRIPTPLRPYTDGKETVTVSGTTVEQALSDLTTQHPQLEAHLFNEGQLRSFVNIFLGEEDIRYLDGVETALGEDDQLLIIPSIAGGNTITVRKVDHSALRTNQAFIIGLLALAFVIDQPYMVAFVSAVMLIGTVFPNAGLFKRIYRHILKPTGIIKPDIIDDNPEPHRFAQLLGGLFTAASTVALLAMLPVLGWALTWLVILLAALNLFLGFCAGCFVYYQFNKLGVPGFGRAPVKVE